ncbi:MAG: hypothetical protein ACREMW_03330 [Gemmatimonadales bacterium]
MTKFDWNTTMFAGKEPITTALADDVGEILRELPPHVVPRTTVPDVGTSCVTD